jgi:hypothetical protein
MEIQSIFINGLFQWRFKQVLTATVKWIFIGILIVWIIFCLAVSLLTFLAGLLMAAERIWI